MRMPTRPKQATRPAYNERDSLTDVATRDEEATALLQGHGLQVKRVNRYPDGRRVVEWRKDPTAEDVARADELLPKVQHAS